MARNYSIRRIRDHVDRYEVIDQDTGETLGHFELHANLEIDDKPENRIRSHGEKDGSQVFELVIPPHNELTVVRINDTFQFAWSGDGSLDIIALARSIIEAIAFCESNSRR